MNIEYHYIGKEYGFYIKTVNLGSEHYRSDVIVYDIVYDIPDSRIVGSSPVETSCGINVLFTYYYDGIT